MKPWDGIVSEEDQRATYAAGFGRPGGVGKRPALLVIDVQYRTTGTKPMPFWAAIKEFPTSCGEAGWNAMRNIGVLVPHDAVYDRSHTSHAVNLFDMAAKYADVGTTAEILKKLRPLAKAPAIRKAG